MLKKSTFSVIGLVCIAIWTLGLTGCSDSKEHAARKQLIAATQQADELCRAASAESANPSVGKDAPNISALLEASRKDLTAAINDNTQYADALAEELALAKSSLAQIESVDAQSKLMLAGQQLAQCDSMMGDIFDLFTKAQIAASNAASAKEQEAFDTTAFASKIEKNDTALKETQTRLANIKSALTEKKSKLTSLTEQMNEKSLKSQTLMRESQQLPAGQSTPKLNEALALNSEIGKIQQNVTKLESESASLAMLIESLELKVKSLQDYGKSLESSQKTMNDMAAAAKSRTEALGIAADDARKKLSAKCDEFIAMQKKLCTNADACQKSFEKAADLMKRAITNASDDFKDSMQLKQAELGMAAASIGLDMIAFKKRVAGLQDSLNKGGMNIAIDESVKNLADETLASSAVTNCQGAISLFDRMLRSTPSKGKWRMHSALASANIMLCRALKVSGNTAQADSALKAAEDNLKDAREKSQWLAKSNLDVIELQIQQAK